MLGAGDMFVMFDDRPEVRATLEWPGHTGGSRGLDRGTVASCSPNKTVPVDWYTTYPTQRVWRAWWPSASTFGFDASDLMPAEVGAGTFWSGMVDWVAADGENTEAIFQAIEDSWPAG